MEIIKDYWTIILAIITLIWFIVKEYFAFQRYKERFNATEERSISNENKIAKIIESISTMQESLISKILLEVAEKDKQILVHVLEQEKSNNANNNAWIKVFGDIEKQLSNINLKLDSNAEDTKQIFMRVESMEKERLEELKKKIDDYKNHQNHKNHN